MKTYLKKIELVTTKQFEIIPLNKHLDDALNESGIKEGLVNVFSPHTTAAIRINHQESLLIQDLMKALYRLIPMDISYNHDLFELRQSREPNERSNGHAHVKAFLLGASEQLIVEQGKVLLGEKQTVFFVELDGGRNRQVFVKIIGN
jgi:secondary thiamine-phosphate synthase enzyme